MKLVSSRTLNGLAFCESTDLCQRFDRISTRESHAHYLTISERGRDSFSFSFFSVVPMHHFTVKSHQTRTAIIFDWRVGIVIRTSPPVSWRYSSCHQWRTMATIHQSVGRLIKSKRTLSCSLSFVLHVGLMRERTEMECPLWSVRDYSFRETRSKD